ncbi:S-layer homology domain-containing protein [Cohnella nanjingensis]|nr:S-layer homology domain-containing protein [Cohnella nanjingensis]
MNFPIDLIDPSGIVYNAEKGIDWPLPGATLVLQYYDTALEEWVDMNDHDKMSPITNPQTSGEDGSYAWDVAAGTYRVTVNRPGFATVTSDSVDIPPPKTDLHVGLTPTDRVPPILTVTGVTYGATYTQPVTIQFQALDDQSGVRYVEYRLDQGEAQRANGDSGSISVTGDGSHTVDFTVVDHAGNEFAERIAFTIAGTPEPSGNADLKDLVLSDIALSPRFDPGTTAYTASVANGVSSVTVTASVYDADNVSVTASVYNSAGVQSGGPHILTNGASSSSLPLSEGSNAIKLVVTAKDGASKTYTVTVTRARSSSGGSTPTGGSPGSTTGVPSTKSLRIFVDGKSYDQIAQIVSSQEGGSNVMSVTLETSRLTEALGPAGDRPLIVIPVTEQSGKVTAVLAGDAVKALEQKRAVLELQTPRGSYTLPASEVGIDALAKQLGDPAKLADILVRVSVAKGDSAEVKLLENTAARDRFDVVVPPVEFTVTASSGGKTANVGKFGSYVKRVIPLPGGAASGNITTAVALEADGTTRHVPTYTESRDGKAYAVFHSLTNSAYALIWRSVSFADVEGHWAKPAVNDLASRKIVSGVDETHYRPNAPITRAEFAAILVRALGLAENGKTSSFTDVKAGDWYIGAVAKAQEYGIVEGYKDGTFGAAKTITRQEAIAMIARAMKLAGLDTNIGPADADAALSGFSDGAAVAGWARQAVAAAVKSGLVGGSGSGLNPASDITRAETAAIVQRMLAKAKLI